MTGRLLLLAAALAVAGCRTAAPAVKLTPKEQAQVYLDRGDGASAVPLLEKLHQASPQDFWVARSLAEAHVKAQTGDALLARLEGEDDAVSWYMKGLVLFARAADASGPAIAAFEKAVALAPQQGELHYRLGLAYLESEKYEQALPPLKEAVRLEPDKAGWQLPLAKALARTGDRPGAVAAIRLAVTGDAEPDEVKNAAALMEQLADPFGTLPRAARPRLEQAMQWLQVADVPQQAILQLEELNQEYPDQAPVHALLGMAYARIDDAGRAVDELKRAIDLAPDDGKNHLYLAEIYLGRQRTATAREHLEKAVQLNPTLHQAWFQLGDLALERKELAGARQAFGAAARLAPDSIPAHGKLALVHQLEEDWPAAERQLKAVLEKEPENVEFMLRMGLLNTDRYLKSKKPAERDKAAADAEEWLKKVLDQQPENALASRALERVREP